MLFDFDKGASEMVNMELLLLILLFPAFLCYREDYMGFDDCNRNGWHCEPKSEGLFVTYRCGSIDRNARIWVWTARVPRATVSIGIENCNHAEIHMDCTMGTRSYNLKYFQAKNIEHLEFLEPLSPYVFLHDNDKEFHAPPEILLENVNKLTVYPGIFDKARGRCRYKQKHLETLDFKNVIISNLQSGVINNNVQTVQLKNTTIKDFGKLEMKGDLMITDSRIGVTQDFSIDVTGNKVILRNNTFERLGKKSIHLRTPLFEFTDNVVVQMESLAFDVVAHNVTIAFNRWVTLPKNGFELISPGVLTSQTEIAVKSQYIFIGNKIEEMELNSLSPNYVAYQEICSQMNVTNNELPCTCELAWTARFQQFNVRGFYELLTQTDTNKCRGDTECTLQMVLTLFPNETCPPETHVPDLCKTSLVTVPYITEEYVDENLVYLTAGPDESFMEDAFYSEETSVSVAAILIPIAVIVIAAAALIYWFQFRNKRRNLSVKTAYQNHWRSDNDEETLIDERPNSDLVGRCIISSTNSPE